MGYTQMMINFWQWGAFAGILFLMEVLLAGGTFILWIGFTAVFMALLTYFVPSLSVSSQLLIFGVLSVANVLVWKRFFQSPCKNHDPLNDRSAAHIGTNHVLKVAIIKGEGLLILDDTRWIIKGDDMPVGTQIRITAFKNGYFDVEKVNDGDRVNKTS